MDIITKRKFFKNLGKSQAIFQSNQSFCISPSSSRRVSCYAVETNKTHLWKPQLSIVVYSVLENTLF